MDFSLITDFFSSITGFIDDFWNWLYIGIYDFVKEILSALTKVMIYAYFKSAIFAAEIGYDVVQDIFVDLGIAREVEDAYSSIPSEMRATLEFFKIPQGLVIIFSAIPTRWAMKFIPFIGR